MKEATIVSVDNKEVVSFIHRVFGWMFVGLTVTAITAFAVASSQSLTDLFIGNTTVFIVLLIIELVAVVSLTKAIQRLSPVQAGVIFIAYAVLNGLTLSALFLAYDISSIANAFLASAGTFGIMAAYGYFTEKDLTSIGRLAFMGLIGIILASLVNAFFQSSGADIVISYIGVLVFVGLTAYDVQKLKRLNTSVAGDVAFEQKQSIIGALMLYLDFINLFISILGISGKRRR